MNLKRPTVFIAAPFKSKINPKSGQVFEDYRRFLLRLVEWFASKGFDIRSSHIREEWGQKKVPKEDFVPVDFEAVRSCDLFVTVFDGSQTIGVLIEIGWASAMDKRIIVLSSRECEVPEFIKGLQAIHQNFSIVRYDGEQDLFESLERVIYSQW